MLRSPANFKQCDVIRIWKAARAAGVDVERTEIYLNGRIVIIHKTDASAEPADAALATWQAVKAKRNARQA
jgi:hypothetical protein